MWQDLVLNHDRARRVLRELGAGRGHRGHRRAREANFGDRRLDNRLYSRQMERRAGIEILDFRMSVRTAADTAI